MDRPEYRYRPFVLAALREHGVVPQPTHHPREVYDLLKCIYTFEIREANLRRREKERVLGPQPLDDYRTAVRKLRDRYPVLSIHWRDWVEP